MTRPDLATVPEPEPGIRLLGAEWGTGTFWNDLRVIVIGALCTYFWNNNYNKLQILVLLLSLMGCLILDPFQVRRFRQPFCSEKFLEPFWLRSDYDSTFWRLYWWTYLHTKTSQLSHILSQVLINKCHARVWQGRFLGIWNCIILLKF